MVVSSATNTIPGLKIVNGKVFLSTQCDLEAANFVNAYTAFHLNSLYNDVMKDLRG